MWGFGETSCSLHSAFHLIILRKQRSKISCQGVIYWSPSLTTKLEVELFKVGAFNNTQIPHPFSYFSLWNFSMSICILNVYKNAQDSPITETHKTENQNNSLTLYYSLATRSLSLLSSYISPKYTVYVVFLFPHLPFTPRLLQIWLLP